MLVSPNPATGVAKLKWQTSSDAPLSITIADALGGVRKTFFVRNNINGELSFSVQDLPAGLYLIFVKQEKAQGSAKLFVSH